MLIFNKISDKIHYYLDNIRVNKLNAKIEQFKFDPEYSHVLVVYRLGRQKLLHKMDILNFEREYFEKVSHYDQHRLTKFSTLQHLLQDLFYGDSCTGETLIKYIHGEAKNEQLF